MVHPNWDAAHPNWENVGHIRQTRARDHATISSKYRYYLALICEKTYFYLARARAEHPLSPKSLLHLAGAAPAGSQGRKADALTKSSDFWTCKKSSASSKPAVPRGNWLKMGATPAWRPTPAGWRAGGIAINRKSARAGQQALSRRGCIARLGCRGKESRPPERARGREHEHSPPRIRSWRAQLALWSVVRIQLHTLTR